MPITTWDKLPNVLIQDPARKVAYEISASELAEHATTDKTLSKIDHNTVTFVIPSPQTRLVSKVPPFVSGRQVNKPSVLIQYEYGGQAFFLSWNDLQTFKIDQPEKHPAKTISFILPVGMEMIEKLAMWRSRLLQSGTGSENTDD